MNDSWMIESDYFPKTDAELRICECGAESCIPGKRKGPTVLRFTTLAYQVVCLACNKHGTVASNAEQAGLNWNQDVPKQNPGSLLRDWRKAKNYTLKDVARMTGLSNQTISDLELGKHSSENSRKLIFQGTGIVL